MVSSSLVLHKFFAIVVSMILLSDVSSCVITTRGRMKKIEASSSPYSRPPRARSLLPPPATRKLFVTSLFPKMSRLQAGEKGMERRVRRRENGERGYAGDGGEARVYIAWLIRLISFNFGSSKFEIGVYYCAIRGGMRGEDKEG